MYQETEDQSKHGAARPTRPSHSAMENRWEEAVQANRAILSVFPNDADSYNRLGKAFTELSKFNDAKRPYKRGWSSSPATASLARTSIG